MASFGPLLSLLWAVRRLHCRVVLAPDGVSENCDCSALPGYYVVFSPREIHKGPKAAVRELR
jgi:hypothetical protein